MQYCPKWGLYSNKTNACDGMEGFLPFSDIYYGHIHSNNAPAICSTSGRLSQDESPSARWGLYEPISVEFIYDVFTCYFTREWEWANCITSL